MTNTKTQHMPHSSNCITQTWMWTYGITCSAWTLGDGNCLLHSIMTCVHGPQIPTQSVTYPGVHVLRLALMLQEVLDVNYGNMLQHANGDVLPVTEHIIQVCLPHQNLGLPDIAAAARLLKRHIWVMTPTFCDEEFMPHGQGKFSPLDNTVSDTNPLVIAWTKYVGSANSAIIRNTASLVDPKQYTRNPPNHFIAGLYNDASVVAQYLQYIPRYGRRWTNDMVPDAIPLTNCFPERPEPRMLATQTGRPDVPNNQTQQRNNTSRTLEKNSGSAKGHLHCTHDKPVIGSAGASGGMNASKRKFQTSASPRKCERRNKKNNGVPEQVCKKHTISTSLGKRQQTIEESMSRSKNNNEHTKRLRHNCATGSTSCTEKKTSSSPSIPTNQSYMHAVERELLRHGKTLRMASATQMLKRISTLYTKHAQSIEPEVPFTQMAIDKIIRYKADFIQHITQQMSSELMAVVSDPMAVTIHSFIKSDTFKNICSKSFNKLPRKALLHVAKSILGIWKSTNNLHVVQYVPPEWTKQHSKLLHSYMHSKKFNPQQHNPTDCPIDTEHDNIIHLQLMGFTSLAITQKISMLCEEWNNHMRSILYALHKSNKRMSVVAKTNLVSTALRAAGYNNFKEKDVTQNIRKAQKIAESVEAYLSRMSTSHMEYETPDNGATSQNMNNYTLHHNFFMDHVKHALPITPCIVCDRLLFINNVQALTPALKERIDTTLQCDLPVPHKTVPYVCASCVADCAAKRKPKFSVQNRTSLPPLYNLPDLNTIESKLVAIQIPFITIQELQQNRGGKQYAAKGTVINIPSDVYNTVACLPRLPDEAQHKLLRVSILDNKDQPLVAFEGLVRPNLVHQYMEKLVTTPLYVDNNIRYDPLTNVQMLKEVVYTLKPDIAPPPNDNDSVSSDESEPDGLYHAYGTHVQQDVLMEEFWTPKHVSALDDINLQLQPTGSNTYAGLLYDINSAEKCFPHIFLGQYYFNDPDRPIPVNRNDLLKHLTLLQAPRARCDPAFMFYAMQCKQLKQASESIHVRLRKMQHKGKPITVKDVLLAEDDLIKDNIAYRELEKIYGTPDELTSTKKNYKAMLRQLGHFQIFLTLTSSDAFDKEVCTQLLEFDDYIHPDYPEHIGADLYDRLQQGTTKEVRLLKNICKDLARKYSTFIAQNYARKKQYFFENLLPHVLPAHPLLDYFANDEFGSRGNQHTHALLKLLNVPAYYGTEESKKKVVDFIDSICSCSITDLPQHLREVQTHKHINCKKNSHTCRFKFPRYPMLLTEMLEPIPEDELQPEDATNLAANLQCIQATLQDIWHKGKIHTIDVSVEDFLASMSLTYDEYILAIRSELTKPTVFLKRNVNEININNYMRDMLATWGANMDIQFVIDPYAAIEYICNYITKGPRGMSDLMQKLTDKARTNNMSVPDFIMKKANLFFNRRETSLLQAINVVLDLPLRLCSRQFVYIPTNRKDERVRFLKNQYALHTLHENDAHSQDVFCTNIIDKYAMRPSQTTNANEDRAVDLTCVTLADFASKFVCSFKGRGLCVHERSGPAAIIRFRNYNKDIDPEDYYREMLLLHMPWHGDEDSILHGCQSYQEAYSQNVEGIQHNWEHYNALRVEAINKRFKLAENKASKQDEDYVREVLTDMHVCDVEHFKSQLKIKRKSTFAGATKDPMRISKYAYCELVSNLSEEQRKYYEHVKFKVMENQQLREFLTGGAGVGKSQLAKAITQFLIRHFNQHIDHNITHKDRPTVLLMSFTGTASFNVQGQTIHSTFALPVTDPYYHDATANQLADMLFHYSDVKFIVIDEISMVSAELFYKVDQRLRQLSGRHDVAFGGYHVLLVGDLFQLKPVGGTWVFKPPKDTVSFAAAMYNEWVHFKMYELVQVQRTKQKWWAELQNRMREGNMTEDDITNLTRMVRMPQKPMPWVCTTNRKVDGSNDTYAKALPGKSVHSLAEDTQILEGTSLPLPASWKYKIASMPLKLKQRMADDMMFKKDMVVELTYNVDTPDGFTNGAQGHVTDWDIGDMNELNTIWVDFDDPRCGVKAKANGVYIAGKGFPIHKVEKEFNIHDGRSKTKSKALRRQFPLAVSNARTVHRVQGLTLDEYCIDIDTDANVQPGIVYVAFSRGTDPDRIYVTAFDASWIKVDPDVQLEMQRLRTENNVQFTHPFHTSIYDTNTFHVVSHNAQTFRPLYYNKHPILPHTDVMFVSEINEPMPAKRLAHNLQLATSYHERRRGCAMYVKNTCQVISARALQKSDVEILVVEVKHKATKKPVLLVGVYAHVHHPFKTIQNMLNMLLHNTHCHPERRIVCMGDFNLPRQLNDDDQLHNMNHMLPFVPTTTHGTMIDYIISNVDVCVGKGGVYPVEWSDHHITYADLPLTNL
jgi:PIF1-like helicase/Helitron helicase-like domain at N-terminus